jgi:hypothetical protein
VNKLQAKILRLGTGLSALTTGAVFAQADGGIQGGINAANTGETPEDPTSVIQNVIRVLLFIVGAAAVIMLIIGGIRYILSSGDQNAVASAKNTILYAIIGIIVAVLAYAAVNFVFQQVSASA